MRYVVRFNNGAWKVLDLIEYRDVGVFWLRKTASECCEEANLEHLAARRRN